MNKEFIEGYIYDEFQKDINDILDNMDKFLESEKLSQSEKDIFFSQVIKYFENKIKELKEENKYV